MGLHPDPPQRRATSFGAKEMVARSSRYVAHVIGAVASLMTALAPPPSAAAAPQLPVGAASQPLLADVLEGITPSRDCRRRRYKAKWGRCCSILQSWSRGHDPAFTIAYLVFQRKEVRA
jgi:hypothetical protein